ncbi:MAG: enoyl-CoA hydratase/isomerase family protein [Chitinophagales bacterium]|nr:enoyl-CoA hydratase/isomerase family protein [Hyphomicrobiales bacterium]
MSDLIKIERDGAIATVTLNRPEKLNAMTKPMWGALADIMLALSTDDGLRCVILRGAGGKAFSPGNDISEFETERSNPEQAAAYSELLHKALAAIRNCRHPTVALIEGICVGGGMEIAACCDIRVCGEGARFGAPINKLGLVMAYPEIEGLRRLVGRAATLEILLEGQIFGAARALQLGLITRVTSDAEVEREAYATAQRIADGAPLVARWHKAFLRRLESGEPLTQQEIAEGYACYATEDFKIGYQSFLAKTKPEFTGR